MEFLKAFLKRTLEESPGKISKIAWLSFGEAGRVSKTIADIIFRTNVEKKSEQIALKMFDEIFWEISKKNIGGVL